jgi:hypothetical protein
VSTNIFVKPRGPRRKRSIKPKATQINPGGEAAGGQVCVGHCRFTMLRGARCARRTALRTRRVPEASRTAIGAALASGYACWHLSALWKEAKAAGSCWRWSVPGMVRATGLWERQFLDTFWLGFDRHIHLRLPCSGRGRQFGQLAESLAIRRPCSRSFARDGVRVRILLGDTYGCRERDEALVQRDPGTPSPPQR